MIEKEFNLINERWILALDYDGEINEVSILELFQRAHQLVELAGEMPTQNLSVLRLLLGITHSVFGRPNELDGFSPSMKTEEDALARWKKLRELKQFPIEYIETYLRKYEDRFYLFHPEYPFYQVASLNYGTSYGASKLNGEISESSNKLRLFPIKTGSEKNILSYPEAARWLLHVNNFDDTSSKPTKKGSPSPGVGWLGKLGNITAKGENLFETLLLNLVLTDQQGNLWEDGKPIWEQPIQSEERREIALPSSQVELLTLQSRRLLLKRNEDKVIGFLLLGGDFFQKENAFSEVFTIWRPLYKGKELIGFTPRRHNPSLQIWRDFSSLLLAEAGRNRPGIVEWLSKLTSEEIIKTKIFEFSTAAINYGDKDFFADDVIDDSISFSSTLLKKLNTDWIIRIIQEIQYTESLVNHLCSLARRLALAKGSSSGDSDAVKVKELAYFQIDPLFREWLRNINPETDDKKTVCDLWWKTAQKLIREIGRDLVRDSGTSAYVGRMIEDRNKIKKPCNSSEAFNTFLYFTKTKEISK